MNGCIILVEEFYIHCAHNLSKVFAWIHNYYTLDFLTTKDEQKAAKYLKRIKKNEDEKFTKSNI